MQQLRVPQDDRTLIIETDRVIPELCSVLRIRTAPIAAERVHQDTVGIDHAGTVHNELGAACRKAAQQSRQREQCYCLYQSLLCQITHLSKVRRTS